MKRKVTFGTRPPVRQVEAHYISAVYPRFTPAMLEDILNRLAAGQTVCAVHIPQLDQLRLAAHERGIQTDVRQTNLSTQDGPWIEVMPVQKEVTQ